jgi:hypothetical protein
MNMIIDILGMMIIRASIVAIILNLMINLHEALFKQTERIYLSEAITAAQQTISADLKLAGYNSSDKRFLIARTNEMSIRADIDNSGSVDSVRYYLNPSSGSNKVLYRIVNGTGPIQVARNVDTFYVRYYTSSGGVASASPPTNVTLKSVFVRLVLSSNISESTASGGTSESGTRTAKWEQLFFPENL